MSRLPIATVLLALLTTLPLHAEKHQGVLRVQVEPFVLLPAGYRQPEGLDIDPRSGAMYVGTFDAREPASERRNALLRYSANGRLEAVRGFGPTPLTGVLLRGSKVYVLNFGEASLQRLDSDFSATSPIETVARFGKLSPSAPVSRRVDNPDGSHDQITFQSAGVAAPNGLVFSPKGDLYVSDSFQGAVYRIADAERCAPCQVEVVSRSPLLATTGALPFGANGLAFNADASVLYLTNAGDGRLLRMRASDGSVEVVAESLPGADGLIFHRGLLWVAANQIDQVMGLDESGLLRVRALGEEGLDEHAAPSGLLFPASTAVTPDGWMVVTNLALVLSARPGDEWEERVGRWSLARFKIPEELP